MRKPRNVILGGPRSVEAKQVLGEVGRGRVRAFDRLRAGFDDGLRDVARACLPGVRRGLAGVGAPAA